jgi:hypothetical protein
MAIETEGRGEALGKPRLDEEFFGRGKRRRFSEIKGGVVGIPHFVEMRRRAKNKFKTAVREIEFLQLILDVGFFLRLFVLRDFLAETALVLAVEGALNGLGQRRGLEIFRKHRGPRHRLEREPMRAGCRQHGNNHQHLAKFAEHGHTMFKRGRGVKGSQVGVFIGIDKAPRRLPASPLIPVA